MHRLHHMASVVRHRVLRTSARRQTKRLDPAVRAALAQDMTEQMVVEDNKDVSRELQELEQQLEECRARLAESEAREIFLGQRTRQYRTVLDDRARALREEQERQRQQRQEGETFDNETDVENKPVLHDDDNVDEDLERRLEQWERDEDALTSIVQTHVEIMAHCESMRRKIKELEEKRQKCLVITGECQDFLKVADEEETNRQDDDDEEESFVNHDVDPAAAATSSDTNLVVEMQSLTVADPTERSAKGATSDTNDLEAGDPEKAVAV